MSQQYLRNSYLPAPLTVSTFPSDSFLSEISVYQVDSDGELLGAFGAPLDQLAQLAIASGSAEVSKDDNLTLCDSSSAIAIPVHRSGRVVSVVILSAKQFSDDSDDLVGVFECWAPVGVYDELALKHGFYGRMERFRNVSSFVRFEKGTGLPGQVWKQRAGVIHHNLSNHPGFLRAAGTSADLLRTAVGIPIASSVFHGAAVLISSDVSPIARGFEVWHVDGDRVCSLGGAYSGLGEGIGLPPDSTLPLDAGMPGLASDAGGAVLCEDVDTILSGRNHHSGEPQIACALAIPFFDDNALTSVTSLLF